MAGAGQKYAIMALACVATQAGAAYGQAVPGTADPHVVTAPRLISDVGVLFGPEHYPPEAIRRGEQGRVVARLGVGADGAVTACEVTDSSGSASLDRQTCLAWQAARYEPARDAHGHALATVISQSVRWTLPVGVPAPANGADVADVALVLKDVDPAGQVVTTSLEVDELGRLASCTVTSATGSPAIAARACREIKRQIAFKPAVKDGRAVRQVTTQRVLFHPPITAGKTGVIAPRKARVGVPEGWLASTDYPADALRLGKQGISVISWDITETGAVENCRVTSTSGFAELDRAACDAVTRRALFIPAKDAQGQPMRSTMSQGVRWIRQ